MKIGYTVWTWLLDEYNEFQAYSSNGKRDFWQSLREIADLGYDVFENFNVLVNLFEDSPEEFESFTATYGLELVAIYHYLTADFDADMAVAERCCKFVKDHGAHLLNIEAPQLSGVVASNTELKDIVIKLTEMGELVREYEVTLCLHPHCWKTVYLENEIDYVMEHVDPELLSLCMDTAHTQLAGMDPVAAFEKYIDRIKHVHLKDLNPQNKEEDPQRGFVVLGDGIVDFRGVIDVLNKHGYDDNLIVELDWQRVCNYESAMVSRKYVQRVLGM